MGMCCSRRDVTDNDLTHSKYESAIFDTTREPFLYYESQTEQDSNLSNVISAISAKISYKTIKKYTFIDLWNITLFYKENHTVSPYIIWDLREPLLQKENFIKKMKHINYSLNQIKELSHSKKQNFKRFIMNKIILFILSPSTDEKSTEIIEIISLINDIDKNIHIGILNSTLDLNLLSANNSILYNYLDEFTYEKLPYIFLSFSHLSHFRKGGFYFLLIKSEYNEDIFHEDSFCEIYSQFLLKRVNENNHHNNSNILMKFCGNFKIVTIIHLSMNVDNDGFKYKEFLIEKVNGTNTIHEYWINMDINDLIKNKVNIQNMLTKIKKGMEKGNSILIMLDNECKSQWIWFIILMLWDCSAIPLKHIVEYIVNKNELFIPEIQSLIKLRYDEVNKLLDHFGIAFDWED